MFVAEMGEMEGFWGRIGEHFLGRAGSTGMGQGQLRNGDLDHEQIWAGGERPYRKWGLWTMRREVTKMTGPGGPGDGTPSIESLRELRLRALLHDLVNDLGPGKAAEQLGVDRKTLRRGLRTPELSPRLADALERMLLERVGAVAGEEGQRVVALERQVGELAERVAEGWRGSCRGRWRTAALMRETAGWRGMSTPRACAGWSGGWTGWNQVTVAGPMPPAGPGRAGRRPGVATPTW